MMGSGFERDRLLEAAAAGAGVGVGAEVADQVIGARRGTAYRRRDYSAGTLDAVVSVLASERVGFEWTTGLLAQRASLSMSTVRNVCVDLVAVEYMATRVESRPGQAGVRWRLFWLVPAGVAALDVAELGAGTEGQGS